MYIITGGAGFIGSAFLARLNAEGISNIWVVDELRDSAKWLNLKELNYEEYLNKYEFREVLSAGKLPNKVSGIIHMGACSTTTELDMDYLMDNNVRYSIELASYAVSKEIPFIYASSAATYGDGSCGFDDRDENTLTLKPLNRYGYSKQLFDLWVLRNQLQNKIVGLKFFNVFGPNEYHKGGQRSVVHQTWGQIRDTGKMKLFKSLKEGVADGEQSRDFVYVKDCTAVMWWLLQHPKVSGIFNLGTGKSRTFLDLARATFKALNREEQIEYIDMPPALVNQYQYFTEANMDKLRNSGCDHQFMSLEQAVYDYVANHLEQPSPYLCG